MRWNSFNLQAKKTTKKQQSLTKQIMRFHIKCRRLVYLMECFGENENNFIYIQAWSVMLSGNLLLDWNYFEIFSVKYSCNLLQKEPHPPYLKFK